MLCNFHNTAFSVIVYLKCIFYIWKVVIFKFNINDRPHDLNNFTFFS